MQAVRSLPLLRHLELGDMGLNPLLALERYSHPSLAIFRSDTTISLSPEAFIHLLPHQLPALATLDLAVDLCRTTRDLSSALDVLSQQLPQLATLTLRGTASSKHATSMGRPLKDLSRLHRLRHLCIDSSPLVACLAPGLSTLPALTKLDVPRGWDAASGPALALMSRLRSLRVGPGQEADVWVHVLEGARKLQGLTELVLDAGRWGPAGLDKKEVYKILVPVPARLARLGVHTEPELRAATRVLGAFVDEICLLSE